MRSINRVKVHQRIASLAPGEESPDALDRPTLQPCVSVGQFERVDRRWNRGELKTAIREGTSLDHDQRRHTAGGAALIVADTRTVFSRIIAADVRYVQDRIRCRGQQRSVEIPLVAQRRRSGGRNAETGAL